MAITQARPRPSYKRLFYATNELLESALEELALRIECPWCAAGPDEDCIFPSGYRRRSHYQRYKAARALAEEGLA